MNAHRAIFISDVHLGARASQADRLLAWLNDNWAETLYVVGDLFDDLKPHRAPPVLAVLSRISSFPHVIFIPGNHDSLFRAPTTTIGRLQICRDAIHETADGRRFLIMHGDEFDHNIPPSVEALGAWADALARRLIVFTGSKLGARALAASVRAVTRLARGRNFDRRLSAVAHSMGCVGVITGHFHAPGIRVLEGGIIHADAGDWVSSCTALVEDRDGGLRIVQG